MWSRVTRNLLWDMSGLIIRITAGAGTILSMAGIKVGVELMPGDAVLIRQLTTEKAAFAQLFCYMPLLAAINSAASARFTRLRGYCEISVARRGDEDSTSSTARSRNNATVISQ